jgi:Protein of unknown function (DUF1360)
MNTLQLLVSCLAVWRITHLLAEEDGPWDTVVRLRQRITNGWLGNVLDCFYCLSVWVAIPFAAWTGSAWTERAILWPAISGAAILLERITTQEVKAQADQE